MSEPCPNCGYCPHCKRGGYHVYPYWQVTPPQPYPWPVTTPWAPTWISSDSQTAGVLGTITVNSATAL